MEIIINDNKDYKKIKFKDLKVGTPFIWVSQYFKELTTPNDSLNAYYSVGIKLSNDKIIYFRERSMKEIEKLEPCLLNEYVFELEIDTIKFNPVYV